VIGYKVVWDTGDALRSCSWQPTSPHSLVYGVGVETRPNPKCGPLFVFKTLEDVQNYFDWREGRDELKVYACRYRPSRSKRLRGWVMEEEDKVHVTVPWGISWAQGVAMATRVTLIGEVVEVSS
jgi:hypothetical protein